MSTEPNAAAPLRFRGGTFGLLLPFAVLLSGMLLLAAAGKAMPAAFWVPALAAVATALALAKDPAHCADLLIQGMASEMVATMLLAWFLAGIVAQLMKETGLVEGLTWLCISTGLGGRVFPLVAFLCGSFLSLATGTALGTVIALAPILYPVGVALGADGPVMAGAIISAACLGDSAPPCPTPPPSPPTPRAWMCPPWCAPACAMFLQQPPSQPCASSSLPVQPTAAERPSTREALRPGDCSCWQFLPCSWR